MPELLTEGHSELDVFPEGLALHQGIEQAAIQGYSFVANAIGPIVCRNLEAETAGLDLEVGDHVTHPINAGTSREIHQLHARSYLPVGHPDIPVATALTRALAGRIRALRFRYPALEDWFATEAGYQLYRDGGDHISPHRDRKNDQLLGATLTIHGSAVVLMHEPIDKPNDYQNIRQIDEFRTEAGSLMLLRAKGLAGGEQIIHEVLPPDRGSRLILNLRMRPDILPSPTE